MQKDSTTHSIERATCQTILGSSGKKVLYV